MDTTRVKVDTSALDRMERDAPGKAERGMKKIALDAIRIMRSQMTAGVSAPGEPPGVDTGKLKNTLDMEVISSYPNPQVRVHDGVKYGIDLEYGTKFMAARPFFESGIRQAMDNAPAELKELFRS